MNSKLVVLALLTVGLVPSHAQTPFTPLTYTDADPSVLRPSGLVEFHSVKGVLEVDMAAVYDTNNPNGAQMPFDPYIPKSQQTPFPRLAYSCKYTHDANPPVVSYAGPFLRVFPGDRVIIHFKNQLHTERTNIHFHGMSVTPREGSADGRNFGDYVGLPYVNQIDPGTDREYNFLVPKEQRPGLFWYHAHAHGVAENQVGCGLGGPIFVEGQVQQFLASWSAKVQALAAPGVAAQLIPAVSTALPNLVHHVLVLKDFEEPGADAIQGPFEQSVNGKVTYTSTTKKGTPYWITSDGSKQIWSISNESADLYYLLTFHTSTGDQPFEVIARDGGPDTFVGSTMGTPESPLMIPPSSIVSVIVPTDTLGTNPGYVVAQPVNTALGSLSAYRADAGDQYFQRPNPKVVDPGVRTTPWKIIEVHPLAAQASALATTAMPSVLTFPLNSTAPTTSAALSAPIDATYVFSQPGLYVNEPTLLPYESDNNLTFYKYVSPQNFATQVKNPLDIYQPYEPPIATLVPGVPQRWIIQNSTQEWHIFHIHQIQFKVDFYTLINRPYNLQADPLANLTRPAHNYQHPFYSNDLPPPTGLQNGDPEYAGLQDTVSIPPLMQVWITLPMTEGTHGDDPIAGKFVMHCHILAHEDAGMMANVMATTATGTASTAAPTPTTSFIHSLPPQELAAVRTDHPLHLQDATGHVEGAKVFTRSDYSLVTFGFTHCDGACPLTVEKCLAALAKLPAQDQARIAPYFVSLDPQRDHGAALTDYAKAHALPGAWKVLADTDLSGTRAFGVRRQIKHSAQGTAQIWHTSVVYVIDRDLHIRAAFDPEDSSDVMVNKLEKLLTNKVDKTAVTEKKAPKAVPTGVELTMQN